MTPGGSATVVWTSVEAAESMIQQTSSRPAGGSFSAPTDVTPAPESIGTVDTDLAMNAAGDAVVAWPGRSSGGEPVVKAAIRSGRRQLLAPAEVSATSPDFFHPDVAIDAIGNATVIWTRSDGAQPNRPGSRLRREPAADARALGPGDGNGRRPGRVLGLAVRRLADRLDLLHLRRRDRRRRDLGLPRLLGPRRPTR